jgi:adenine-specific DNA-methyltransferase
MFGKDVFNFPKNVSFIKLLIQLHPNTNAIILDFMAGSGTTGHAVMELNKEDGGNRQFILCTNNEELDNNGDTIKHKICTEVCYPRMKKIINGYKNIEGLGGNLKYFTAYDFVEAKETDANKRKLVNKSTEMLSIKENAFEEVQDCSDFKILKNCDKYVGIIFYEEAINDYKEAIRKIDGHFNTYVFSLGDDPHEKEFKDVREKVTLCAIPEVILKVYREIFK